MQATAGGGEEEEAGEEARLFFEDRSGDANAGKVRKDTRLYSTYDARKT